MCDDKLLMQVRMPAGRTIEGRQSIQYWAMRVVKIWAHRLNKQSSKQHTQKIERKVNNNNNNFAVEQEGPVANATHEKRAEITFFYCNT